MPELDRWKRSVPHPGDTSCSCQSYFVHRCYNRCFTSLQKVGGVNQGARIINSVLEGDVAVSTGAVVQHCHLKVRGSL